VRYRSTSLDLVLGVKVIGVLQPKASPFKAGMSRKAYKACFLF